MLRDFLRYPGESIECSRIDFNGQIEKMLRDFLRYPGVFKKSVRAKMSLFYLNSRFGSFIKILKLFTISNFVPESVS